MDLKGASVGCDGRPGAKPEVEELKSRIMAEIEAKLVQKEQSLWQRGSKEIRKLQTEQREFMNSVAKLQERQEALVAENQNIKGALMEVTSKFELIVSDLREVLRAMPHQPLLQGQMQLQQSMVLAQLQEHQQLQDQQHMHRRSHALTSSPSVASTSASEALLDDQQHRSPSEPTPDVSFLSMECVAMSSSTERVRRSTPQTQTHGAWLPHQNHIEPEFTHEDVHGEPTTYRTPPRVPSSPEGHATRGDNSLWHGATPSPAVLSLASALPSASAVSSTSSPGMKLQLAECLEQAGGLSVPASPRKHTDASIGTGMAGQSELLKIEIVKEPGFFTLGIEVNQVDMPPSLRVESVDEHGLVARHNARQDSDVAKLLVGDLIVEANGVRNDPQLMLDACRANQQLNFTVARATKEPPGGTLDGAAEACGGSPCPTKLRPEAQVFVPASVHGDPRAAEPLGYGQRDATDLASRVAPATLMQASTTPGSAEPSVMPSVEGDQAVNRMLFP